MVPGADGRIIIDNVTKISNRNESIIDKLSIPGIEYEIMMIFNKYIPQINKLRNIILNIFLHPLIFKNADLNKDQLNKSLFLKRK